MHYPVDSGGAMTVRTLELKQVQMTLASPCHSQTPESSAHTIRTMLPRVGALLGHGWWELV